jgi:LytS/YehU family sensor histidine kinase
MNRRGEAGITIEEEVEMVQSYLLIEKIRFEEKLEVSFDIAEEAKRLIIPKFILQPIVENAIKYGEKDPDEKREIKVIITLDKNQLSIIVRDNGALFPENMQMGFGLKNVSDKMAWFYPGSHFVHFENSPLKQVVITITNPMTHAAAI